MRRQPTVFSMNPALVDVLDEVARGLGVSRSRVAEAYLEEALRSRCLWPLTPREGTRPASTMRTPSPATSAADASSSEQGATKPASAAEPTSSPHKTRAQSARANHPWRGRARANIARDASLRGKDGLPR